jgi:hypothetical protein
MPYIAQEKRDVLDEAIYRLVDALRQLESDDPENVMSGNINYAFTRVLTGVYSSPRYDDMNTVTGILACVSQEYYRRVASPYENQKAHDNGDVY